MALLAGQLLTIQLNAQQGFTYQAVARNLSGEPLEDQELTVRIGIHAESLEGELIWGEDHSVQTNALGLFTLTVGDPNAQNKLGSASAFDQIDWSATTYYLRVWVKGEGDFTDMGGSAIQTVPLAQHATSADHAMGNFIVQPTSELMEGEALFEVKRKDGQPVFAVYEDMVWVYSDPDATKGSKGGFAVGGYRRSKGITEEYMRVTSDSVRVYVNDDPLKGNKGGFAVGGYRRSKGLSQEFLRVTPDSVRVYIDSDDNTKGSKGGFAVGGYRRTKGIEDLFLNVSGKNSVDVVDQVSQIMWYPKKEAFLAGNIHIGSVDSVGQNSTAMGYRTVAMGNFSQAFGYESMSLGKFSTSFGYKSIASGEDSYAFGSGAVASGFRSFALGVYSKALNDYATSIGYRSEASGRYSNSFGLHAEATAERAMALGMSSLASGYRSMSLGYQSRATGPYTVAIGANSWASSDTAISIGRDAIASGISSVAIGTGTTASGKLSTSIGFNTLAEGYKSISLGAYYYKKLDFFIPIFILPPIVLPKGGDELDLLKDPDPPKGTFRILPLWATRDNEAFGTYSMALGNGNRSENGGISVGVFNDAMDIYSTAVGFANQAVAPYSFAGGFANKTEGDYATAFGRFTSAASLNSFVIGTYNKSTGTSDEWIPTDPLFQIGNGTGPELADQHDAFRVNKNGGTYIYNSGNYYGLYTSSSNARYANYVYNNINTDFEYTTAYGVRSYIYRGKPGVTYYSGYFTDGGSQGVYGGLYADYIVGDNIDVAEYIYDTHGNTEAGDVLIADRDKDESVLRSNEPYQTSVLGVVSTDPHMVMGMDLVMDEETGKPLSGVSATRLALTGRVPVKVTEENGPIEPGDLLTTSSTAGHAMKWTLLDISQAGDFEELKTMLAENERRRNAVIGKAVGSSGNGTGKVMVLISLQ
jgi:hypothetical protein